MLRSSTQKISVIDIKKIQKNNLSVSSSTIFLFLSATYFATSDSVEAAGFAIKEQSTKLQGSSYAGVAEASDSSYMFFNPATLGFLTKPEIQAAMSVIVPSGKYSNAQASSRVGGSFTVSGAASGESMMEDAFVPSLSGAYPINNQFALGFTLNAPWGLEINYNNDWIGRYHAIESQLSTYNLTPIISFKPVDNLSLAAGMQIQYADAKLSSAVNYDLVRARLTATAPNPATPFTDGKATITADDWGYGFVLGGLWEFSKGSRLGLSFKSEVEQDVNGNIRFTPDQAGLYNGLINTAPAQAGLQALGATTFQNAGANATVTLPAQIGASFYHEFTPYFALAMDTQWTGWSSFDELRINFNDGQPDNVTTENWENAMFYALGGIYKPSSEWEFRTGIAYDESPVPDEFRTPRIPDNNRFWLSLGSTYNLSDNISFTGVYSHIWVSDGSVNLVATPANENAGRGNLSAQYKSELDIIMLSGKVSFD